MYLYNINLKQNIMNTIKIQIEKLEKVWGGVLYTYYKATNLDTKETKTGAEEAHYGDDILRLSTLSEAELNQIPTVGGVKYGKEIVVSSEVREYSEESGDAVLEKEGWSDSIKAVIAYVMY